MTDMGFDHLSCLPSSRCKPSAAEELIDLGESDTANTVLQTQLTSVRLKMDRHQELELLLFSILPEAGCSRALEKNVSERTLKRNLVSRFAHSLLDVFRCAWTLGQGVLIEALSRALVKEKMDDLINDDSATEFTIL